MNSDINQYLITHGQLVSNELNSVSMPHEPMLFYVETGHLDVFLQTEEGALLSRLTHFLTVDKGGFFWGVSPNRIPDAWRLVCKPSINAKIYSISQTLLADLKFKEQLVGLVDQWTTVLFKSTAKDFEDDNYLSIQTGLDFNLKPGSIILSQANVLWCSLDTENNVWLDHDIKSEVKSGELFPICQNYRLKLEKAGVLHAISTASLIDQGGLFVELENVFLRFLQAFISHIALRDIVESEQIETELVAKKQYLRGAYNRLLSLFSRNKAEIVIDATMGDDVWIACQAIGQSIGIDFKYPTNYDSLESIEQKVESISEYSEIKSREIILKPDWWRHDASTVLATVKETNKPVALLHKTATTYDCFDPEDQSVKLVDADFAKSLNEKAYVFYRSLPNGKLSLFDLAKFIWPVIRRDVFFLMMMVILISLLNLVIPLVTASLINTVIPSADKSQLYQLAIALLATSFGVAIFGFAKNFSILRMSGKYEAVINPAFWSRLLKMPVFFFSKYAVGDLLSRVNEVREIEYDLFNLILEKVFSAFFGLFSFGLLFVFSVKLALVSLVLILFAMLVVFALTFLMLRTQTSLKLYSGKMQGLLNRLVVGVAKIRMAGAESNMFARWSKLFLKLSKINFVVQTYENALTLFTSIYGLLSAIVIYAAIGFSFGGMSLSAGNFMAFYAAYGAFTAAMLSLVGVYKDVIKLVTSYQRVQPIFEALPESSERQIDPGYLKGAIEVEHLSFSYDQEGPVILNDLSFAIQENEFVAIVGPSGSGKSTLMRLLLRFEQPAEGVIYYDDKDLSELNIHLLRRQMGVVLQNSKLLPSDLFHNIVGSALYHVDDAWRAAEQVGLADDIKTMPMGMYTMVGENGGSLSGGQRQRVLIARAMLGAPRIVFLDEATSALDNKTQDMVTKSLEKLHATKVVIAHRLSTIIKADKIMVIDEGRLVEQGTYEELMATSGLFSELARRQLLT